MPLKALTITFKALILLLLTSALMVFSVLPTLTMLSLPAMPAAPIAAVLIYALLVAVVITGERARRNAESRR